MNDFTFNNIKNEVNALVDQLMASQNLLNKAYKIKNLISETVEPLFVMVMGEFSTGKSTFINALLKKNIAKVGATPTTAVITKFSYGMTDKIEVFFHDGTKRNYSVAEFESLTAESDSGYNTLHEQIEYVSRTIPANILKNMTLIDCPGLNSIKETHEKTTRAFMDKADTVIWLFDAKSPAKQSEFTAFKKLNPRLKPLVILNKTDEIDEEEESVDSIIADIERKLRNNKLNAQKVIGISAKLAFQGVQKNNNSFISASNIQEVQNFLDKEIFSNSNEYKQSSILEELAYTLYNVAFNFDKLDLDIVARNKINDSFSAIYSNLSNYKRSVYRLSPSESLFCGVVSLQQSKFTEATQYFQEASKVGNIIATFLLGEIFYVKLQNYEQAFKYFKKAAESEIPAAFSWLGQMYNEGNGVAKNHSEALKYFQKAIDYGDNSACYELGLLYHHGENIRTDFDKAFKNIKKAAENGNENAFWWLAYMYLYAEGTAQNYELAFKWFKKAAEVGNEFAFHYLGQMYFFGNGVTKDYNLALSWFKKSANSGAAEGFAWLGLMHDGGYGTVQNYNEAFKWFKKAAEAGNTLPCKRLGVMYYTGEGTAKDYNEAFKWFKKAAESGDEDAFGWLGIMYRHGEGTSQNYSEAFKWIKKAAENDDAECFLILGNMYYEGQGTAKDLFESFKWRKKAADNGDEKAFGWLGLMYENGEGVSKNHLNALNWYKKAAESSDDGGGFYKYAIANMYRSGGFGLSQDYDKAMYWYQKAIEAGDLDARRAKESLENEIAKARSVSTYSKSTYSGSYSKQKADDETFKNAAKGAVIGGVIAGPLGAFIGGWIGSKWNK